MHPIDKQTLQRANEEAIYNLYLYLAHKTTPTEHESLQSIVHGLEAAQRNRPDTWSDKEIARLQILRNAIDANTVLAAARISHLTRSASGLTACAFTKPSGEISVVFKGTGSGEWIDNGEGLSGIPQENAYITYEKGGKAVRVTPVSNDYATTQQVEALNWFHSIAAKSGWNALAHITVSGHSKGGNKAQFISMHSDLVDACYSFNGQGFSPEALTAMQNQNKAQYEKRRKNIKSVSACNDYVNVLGERLMPENHIHYIESHGGLHDMEAILTPDGSLRPQCVQGSLSKYVESVSEDLMRLPPFVRQYTTLGVMRIFQKYFGGAVTGDAFSVEKTLAGIGLALAPMLYHLRERSDN